MKSNQMKNVTVICRNNVIRMKSITDEQVIHYINLSVGTTASAKVDGKEYRMVFQNHKIQWIEK